VLLGAGKSLSCLHPPGQNLEDSHKDAGSQGLTLHSHLDESVTVSGFSRNTPALVSVTVSTWLLLCPYHCWRHRVQQNSIFWALWRIHTHVCMYREAVIKNPASSGWDANKCKLCSFQALNKISFMNERLKTLLISTHTLSLCINWYYLGQARLGPGKHLSSYLGPRVYPQTCPRLLFTFLSTALLDAVQLWKNHEQMRCRWRVRERWDEAGEFSFQD